MVTPLTDDASGWDLLTWLYFSLSRFACQALAVHFQGSSGNLDALRFQSRIVLSGCGITILMQSSSVTTSTLSLLVAVGPLRLVKVFPFTDGANVRTTVSGFRHDSCSVSPLLHIGRSAHLVPSAICLGRRTFDVESLGKHRSRHRRVPHTGCHCFLESEGGVSTTRIS